MDITVFTELEFFFRILIAGICGGLIGYERNNRLKEAGIRTHLIVALAAALIMVVSKYGFSDVTTLKGVALDPSRIAAQIVTGVGFLGAGMIFVRNQTISGLTTAAGLWASACMGLAIGAGFYECVILAFLLMFLCIRLLPYLENYMVERARNMNLYIEYTSFDNIGLIIGKIKAQGAQIYEVNIDRSSERKGQYPSAVFTIRLAPNTHHAQVIAAISELDDVMTIDEI